MDSRPIRRSAGSLRRRTPALGVALATTTGAVTVLAAVAPGAGHLVEIAVLVVANATATVVSFVLLCAVITHRPRLQPAVVPTLDRSQP